MNAVVASTFTRQTKAAGGVQTVAGLFAILAGPWLGFLYLGQVWLALAYAAYALIVAIGFTMLYLADLPYLAFMPYKFFYLLLVHIAGALLCANRTPPPVAPLRLRRCRQMALVLCVPVLLLSTLVFTLFSLSSYRMSGTAMAPTIDINAPFFLNAYAYRWAKPERGDVILFTTPDKRGPISRVARIIGLPGDRVAMRLGVPYLNGQPLSVQRVEDYHSPTGLAHLSAPSFEETLPDGQDYRVLSARAPGTGRYDNHPERVVPARSYYVIGDNRGSSRDSRDVSGVGYVKPEQIRGKVFSFR